MFKTCPTCCQPWPTPAKMSALDIPCSSSHTRCPGCLFPVATGFIEASGLCRICENLKRVRASRRVAQIMKLKEVV